MTAGRRLAVAAALATLLMTALGWVVYKAYYPVRPHLVCVMPLGTGATAAYFGWSNEEAAPFTEEIGGDNHFAPGPLDQGQPQRFVPGSSGHYPEGTFLVQFRGPSLTWHLGPREATATAESRRCPLPSELRAQRLATRVLPDKAPPPKPDPKPEPPPKPPPKPVDKAVDKPDPKTPATKKPKSYVKKKGQPKPKRRTAKKKPPVTENKPVPLVLAGVTGLSKGVGVVAGDETILGDSSVAPTPENTNIELVDDPSDLPQKIGDGAGGGEVKCVAPKVRKRVKGVYPQDAPQLGRAVLVRLLLTIDETGEVTNVTVTRPAGASFDREARRVGRALSFAPAKCGGQAVVKKIPWVVEFTPDQW